MPVTAPQPIPSVGSRGTFTVLSPFDKLMPAVALSGASPRMTCVAVQSLTSLVQSGSNPLADFYTANQLDATAYQTDVANNVVIVSLQSDDLKIVQIPSSYIGSFADPNGVPYQVMVLTANLGALRTDIDLTFLNQQVVSTIHDSLGVDTTIKIGLVSNVSTMTQSDSAQVESARQAKISNSTTDAAKVLSLQQTVTLQAQKIAALEALIVANGLASPTPPSP